VSSDNEPDSDPTQGAEEELDEVLEKAADLSVEGVEIPLDYPTQGEPFFEYVESAKRLVGKEEWDNDKVWWVEQMGRDWATMQERAALELELARKRQMGEEVTETETYSGFDRLNALRFIDYDQFILEANAGHFREDRFYCDKGRRWMNKVKVVFATYGYLYVRKVEINGLVVLEVSKNPMGEL
jgi:hypothetical protein